MVMEHVRAMDYLAWGPELDLVGPGPYLMAHDPDAHVELSWSADLTRGTARGRPWWLMEHSTSAVNWQPRNVAKAPGQLARNSLAHVARGADAVCFFQWRASRAGAEKFHSAMLPHAGTDSRVWREVVELGASLEAIAEVAGSLVRAEAAIVVDWDARWAAELDSHPTSDLEYLDRHLALYRALWDAGVVVDMVGPEADLTGYRLVLVPTLYLVTDAGAANIGAYVDGGGTALVTVLERHRRRERPRPAGRLSGRLPGPARGVARRSSRRCARVRRCGSPEVFSTVPRPTCGPRQSTCAAPRWSRATPTAPCPAHRPDRQQQRGREGVEPRGSAGPRRHCPRSCATCVTPRASTYSNSRAWRRCGGTVRRRRTCSC
jgi:hypothetical protein